MIKNKTQKFFEKNVPQKDLEVKENEQDNIIEIEFINDVIANLEEKGVIQVINLNNEKVKLVKDENMTSSSNKAYKKEKDIYDMQYDRLDQICLNRAQLRDLGIPYDDKFEKTNRNLALTRYFSIVSIASGLLSSSSLESLFSSDITVSNGLFFVGALGLASTILISKKLDLSYRRAVHRLTKAYVCSKGKFPDEWVKEAVGYHENQLPDQYDLACMEKEEREKLLEQSKETTQLTKKQKIRRIYGMLRRYEMQELSQNEYLKEYMQEK